MPLVCRFYPQLYINLSLRNYEFRFGYILSVVTLVVDLDSKVWKGVLNKYWEGE